MGTLPKSHSFERHHKDSPIPVSPSKTFPAGGEVASDGAWAIAAHGGAGAISDTASIPARLQEFSEAFAAGQEMLKSGASAMDAVQEVVRRLEDSAYFNAGRGSVFTNFGTHEMDAAIMDGTTGSAGAVANVANIKNPVVLARTVAQSTQHVLLCGAGASSLAPKHGIQVEDNHYFFTEERYNQLKAARLTNRVVLDHGGEMHVDDRSVGLNSTGLGETPKTPKHSFEKDEIPKVVPLGLAQEAQEDRFKRTPPTTPKTQAIEQKPAPPPPTSLNPPGTGGWAEEHKFGTVGCVARDKYGNLAAAGSTGGLTNKHPGRIGDTPIIGAGVYANSKTCAVACTGQGETFIKHCVAHDVHARMKYQGAPLAAAIDEVILNVLPSETGGMIGVDAHGKVHASYNTAGMFTGLADHSGRYETWHNTHARSEDTMTKLNIVPTIMDEFHVTGMLKVWYLAKIGAVSTVYINASSGRRLRTAQCQSVPNVFFAGTGKNSVPCLHTLVMVAPDHRDGHPKLLWLVTNIPNAEVADGEVLVEYTAPDSSYDEHDVASRFIFLLFKQSSEAGMVPQDFEDPDTVSFDLRAYAKEHNLTPIMCTSFRCGTRKACDE